MVDFTPAEQWCSLKFFHGMAVALFVQHSGFAMEFINKHQSSFTLNSMMMLTMTMVLLMMVVMMMMVANVCMYSYYLQHCYKVKHHIKSVNGNKFE